MISKNTHKVYRNKLITLTPEEFLKVTKNCNVNTLGLDQVANVATLPTNTA
jgi:hypothetical protein